MNRMLGWFGFNGSVITLEKMQATRFKTPHWQPDHHAIFAQGSIALSATQRFITPECHKRLMPYEHSSTGCVINADVYLTNRESLCGLLEMDAQTADVSLLLQAYLKWGKQCTRYLAGHFCFIIWDPRHSHVFAAVDQFAHAPLFYIYRPKQFLMMANECSAFPILYPDLTINSKRLIEFARDAHSQTETAYQEICKLPAGHQLVVTTQQLHQTCYWHWKNERQRLPYQHRKDYYAAFQAHFEQAVQRCCRRLGPLTTQISGGLDSSAVTAQAASMLAKQQENLFSFTSIPNTLSGKSYRPGWYYHEMPRIKTVLECYPNIQHLPYIANAATNIFEKLKPLQHCFDQPLRNITNMDWTMACYEAVLAKQGRLLLIGAGGNGTISWAGNSAREILFHLRHHHRWTYHLHETMLSGYLTAPLRATVYALQLWYGVRRLDPTQELSLAVFCYNVPNWVYRYGHDPLQQRLLIRNGLEMLLPEAIRKNPYRGEQGADWYLHYNTHAKQWREQLIMLTQKAQTSLWQSYDRQKIMNLFDAYPYLDSPPDRKITHEICHQLLRCLSMGFYMDAIKF